MSDVALFALACFGFGVWIFGWFLYDNGNRWLGRLCWAVGLIAALSGMGGIGFGGVREWWGHWL